jgi:hypothetical protein
VEYVFLKFGFGWVALQLIFRLNKITAGFDQLMSLTIVEAKIVLIIVTLSHNLGRVKRRTRLWIEQQRPCRMSSIGVRVVHVGSCACIVWVDGAENALL